MNNDNNTPKSASHMLYHELAANGGTKRDNNNIPSPEFLRSLAQNDYNIDGKFLADGKRLYEIADEIRDLREAVNDLSAWSEGAEADNDTLRKEIARLRDERDAARRDFCNASYDDPHLVARERGWDCFKNEKQHTYICDHCGETTDSDNAFHYAELPQDIASANKGESATLCRKCEKMIEANANNADFRNTDMS